jgi:hypothetical protein
MPKCATQAILQSGLTLALVCCSPFTLTQTLQPYGACTPPAQQGVNVCGPYNAGYFGNSSVEIPSPFQVIAAGTSGRGNVANMQLWADGKKIMQTAGTPFDQPITLPPGNHQLTVIEVDDTGYYAKSAPFNVVVDPNDIASPCSPPAAPGVHICLPDQPCNTQTWIDVSASAKGQTGPVVRMEMWITEGSGYAAKIANFPGSSFETHPILFTGFYTLEVWEIDSNGYALKADLPQAGPC